MFITIAIHDAYQIFFRYLGVILGELGCSQTSYKTWRKTHKYLCFLG